MENQDPKETKDEVDLMVAQVLMVDQDPMDPMVWTDVLEKTEVVVRKEDQDQEESRVKPDLSEVLVRQAFQDFKDLEDQRGRKELMGKMELMENLVMKVHKDHREHRVNPVLTGLTVFQDEMEVLV